MTHQLHDLYFPVLDHGFVALVDHMGGDARCGEGYFYEQAAAAVPKLKKKGT